MTAAPEEKIELTDTPGSEPSPSIVEDIERIDPVSDVMSLPSNPGLSVKLVPMNTRQFFAFLRIITHGGFGLLSSRPDLIDINVETDIFIRNVIFLTVFSVPEAPQETFDFIKTMIDIPDNVGEGEKDKAAGIAARAAYAIELDVALRNPPLEDFIELISHIIQREGSDIQALGKRLAAMFKIADKTGQLDSLKKS